MQKVSQSLNQKVLKKVTTLSFLVSFIFSTIYCSAVEIKTIRLESQRDLSLTDTIETNLNAVKNEVDFFNSINLDFPGLAKVKVAVNKQDWQVAKTEWMSYLQTRTAPIWVWSHKDRKKIRTAFEKDFGGADYYNNQADKILNKEFTFNGVYKKLESNFNWRIGTPIWEQLFSRHDWIKNLGYAYILSGNTAYVKDFNSLIKDWVKTHPVPADVSKTWNSRDKAWMTLEAGFRLENWMDILEAFTDASEFDQEARYLMSCAMLEQARYLISHETKYRVGNWQMAECTGLASVGIMFPEFKESAIWREKAFKYLVEHMEKDVYADGAQVEVTPGYHIAVLQQYAKIALLSKKNGYIIPRLLDKHEKMFDFIMNITKPDIKFPGLGDATSGTSKTVLGLGALLYNREDMRWLGVDKAQPEWVWLFGPNVVDDYQKLKSMAPTLHSVLLPNSKYAVMRTGWKEKDSYLLFDCAPSLGSHSHGDRLQVLVFSGRDLLIDPGQYSYAEPLMGYFRSTKPHNVLVIDGKEQEWVDPEVISWHVGKNIEYAAGKMTLKELSHQRTVIFLKPHYWLVVDHISAESQHEYTRQFQFPILSNAKADGNSVFTQFASGTNILVKSIENAKLNIFEMPIPTSHTTTIAAPQAAFITTGKSTILSTMLMPFDEHTLFPKIKRLESSADIIVIQLTFPDGRIDKIAVAAKETLLKIGNFSHTGTVLYVRTNKKGEENIVD